MDHAEIQAEIQALLASLKSELHPTSHAMVADLVAHGERKVALEVLCEHLNELGVALSPPVHSRLMKLLSALGLREVYRTMVPMPRKPEAGGG